MILHHPHQGILDNLTVAIALARELGVSLKILAQAFRLDTEGVPDDEPR